MEPTQKTRGSSLSRWADIPMITTGPIEGFFKAPTDPPADEGDCLLYHLRCDLESLYGAEGATTPVSPSHTLLATMGILSLIDYLSQAYSNEPGGRKRFVETVHNLAHLSSDESEGLKSTPVCPGSSNRSFRSERVLQERDEIHF